MATSAHAIAESLHASFGCSIRRRSAQTPNQVSRACEVSFFFVSPCATPGPAKTLPNVKALPFWRNRPPRDQRVATARSRGHRSRTASRNVLPPAPVESVTPRAAGSGVPIAGEDQPRGIVAQHLLVMRGFEERSLADQTHQRRSASARLRGAEPRQERAGLRQGRRRLHGRAGRCGQARRSRSFLARHDGEIVLRRCLRARRGAGQHGHRVPLRLSRDPAKPIAK